MKRSEVVTKKLSCYFTIEMKVKNVTKRKSSSMNKLQRWKQEHVTQKKILNFHISKKPSHERTMPALISLSFM